MRKSFNTEFMAKVALEAIKEEKTIAELSSQYEVHRTQITNWRKRALEGLVGIFQGKEARTVGEKEKVIDELYRQIGQLKVENEGRLIEGDNKELSIRRRCELIGLPRSNWYYEPVEVSDETLRLMHRVDEIFYRISILRESPDTRDIRQRFC